jgi:UDP-N-acetylmuramate: L-alanyl-gamma-D-glutamyl-meso-diaminopimelate ligase
LIAVFEPRSATASRRIHQDDYVSAFAAADVTLLAPVGRSEIPEAERLDVNQLVADIAQKGPTALALGSAQTIADHIAEIARPGDTVVAMSNGAFDNVHERILGALGARLLGRRTA